MILTANKEVGTITTTEIPNYYIVNFVLNPDGNLVTLNQTGDPANSTVKLTTFSPTGEKMKETVFPGASLNYSNALAADDNGIVFGIKESDGPVLVKTDFNNNILWEKRFSNELDPALEGAEYIEPGTIQCIKRDVDGNFIIAQHLTEKNTEDLEDSGYVIYQVNPNGELIWAKPYYWGVTAWQQDTFVHQMILLEDGSIVIETMSVGGDPGSDIWITYLDNQGDFIRDLHQAHTGIGPLALSADHCLIYSNRELDPQTGTDETVCYKFGLDGTTIWKKTYKLETENGMEVSLYPHTVIRNSDDTFLIVNTYGIENSNTYGIALLKIDKNGERINQLTF
ncbi:MAG: hypothetical protein GXO69_03275 [Acidobacteria bacterium]|nr:hypothetical protein [Acidobacteriota bacterium]